MVDTIQQHSDGLDHKHAATIWTFSWDSAHWKLLPLVTKTDICTHKLHKVQESVQSRSWLCGVHRALVGVATYSVVYLHVAGRVGFSVSLCVMLTSNPRLMHLAVRLLPSIPNWRSECVGSSVVSQPIASMLSISVYYVSLIPRPVYVATRLWEHSSTYHILN